MEVEEIIFSLNKIEAPPCETESDCPCEFGVDVFICGSESGNCCGDIGIEDGASSDNMVPVDISPYSGQGCCPEGYIYTGQLSCEPPRDSQLCYCCNNSCQYCPCNWKFCNWPEVCGPNDPIPEICGGCIPEEFDCYAFFCDTSTGNCFSAPNVIPGSGYTNQEECDASCVENGGGGGPTGSCVTQQLAGGTNCRCDGECCPAGQTCSKDPNAPPPLDGRCTSDQPQCQCSCRASYASSRLVQDFTWKGSSPP